MCASYAVSDLLGRLEPERVLRDLRALADLTSDAGGAQRVAWSEPWLRARHWLSAELAALPVLEEIDEAGNQWATLPGRSPQRLVIGGHLDSVPNGGWLDGVLNVVAGLEVLRACAAEGSLPLTVRLVSWADEEGRFAHSLFGSSAAAGLLDPDAVAGLTDAHGATLKDVLASHGVDSGSVGEAKRQLVDAIAYLELHIEQGPVLWRLNRPLGVVTGTKGLRRSRVRYLGQAAHAGSTPMARRQDALVAAARFVTAARDLARSAAPDVVSTAGMIRVEPDVPTVVPGVCEVVIDQRAIDQRVLDRLHVDTQGLSDQIAREEQVECFWTSLYEVPATIFDPDLVAICEQAVSQTSGEAPRLPSGPLHDATAMSRAGVPTGMIFVQSIGGHSHSPQEDTREEDIRLAVTALCRAAGLCLARSESS
jgi:hydantoinase/carbamoylase family amidase